MFQDSPQVSFNDETDYKTNCGGVNHARRLETILRFADSDYLWHRNSLAFCIGNVLEWGAGQN